jgi:DNA-binding HxlR family transcriptional regulator
MSWTDEWLRMDASACSVTRTLDLVGEKWTLLVLREVMNGVRRFEQVQAHIGAPRAVLSARFARLVDAGVLERRSYREPGQRARDEYRLTDKGEDLRPVLISLLAFGDKHLSGRAGPLVELRHRGCGEPVGVALVCAGDHVLADRHELEPHRRPLSQRRAT